MTITVQQTMNQTRPKLCKDCRYFVPYKSSSHDMRYNLGKCRYFETIDLVSGDIVHDYVHIAREYKCKGEYFEEKPILPPKTFWENLQGFFEG